MFTGIIKSKGRITDLKKFKKENVLKIEPIEPNENIFEDLKIGASVSVDGICLTIREKEGKKAVFNVMEETVNLTNLKFAEENAQENKELNLEPAMKVGDSLDGHIIQGHIDATGKVVSVKEEPNQTTIKFAHPKEFAKHLALKGSITINGVSLTIAYLDMDTFDVCLVKHTLENTNLSKLKEGDIVNLEFDAISKYLERLLEGREGQTKYAYLVERGFI